MQSESPAGRIATPFRRKERSAPAPAGGSTLRHEAALDGLRGIAVLAVLFFHAGLSWAGGGWLGVEVFFVLSGFLITSLLLAEWQGSGGIGLRGFWMRRARRLLPALFVLVVVCAVYEALAGPARAVPDFSADGLATLFYVANWHQIWTGSGYFAQVGLVSPLQHTWSLAIEEQFYLVWPLALVGLLALGRRLARGASGARVLLPVLVVSGLGAIAAAVEMGVLYHGGSGLDRVYYGTDTRASGILVGAFTAVAISMARSRAEAAPQPVHRRPARLGFRLLVFAGLAAAVADGFALASARSEPAWLFEGGMLGIDVATAVVILACVVGAGAFSPLRSLLSFRPLVAVGLISYGLYLWHFPLFQWLTTQSTGLAGNELLALRLGATFAVSTASYFLVELPVRRRRLPKLALRALAPIAASAALAMVLVAGEVTAQPVLAPVNLATGLPTATPRSKLPPSCRYEATGRGRLTFHTCPPLRVMLVGDSIALTVGMELTIGEQRYGVLLDNHSILGCSFNITGDSDEEGTVYGGPNSQCLTEYEQWIGYEKSFRPQVVLVEMGYWDSMNWRWGTSDYVHLGVPAFDAEVEHRMQQLVDVLGGHGRQVVFLTVPWTDPLPWPNGQQEPQASAARHVIINHLLREVAAKNPRTAHVFDLSPYITPSGHYQASVDGELCRMSDGIHLYLGPYETFPIQTMCGALLQRGLFDYLRGLAGLNG